MVRSLSIVWSVLLLGPASAATWFDTLPAARQSAILWRADHESGNISQWESDAPWQTGGGSWAVVTSTKHSGSYSVRSAIDTSKNSAGVRWPRRTVPGTANTLPNEAYYSAWFNFPSLVEQDGWMMAMQWKTAGVGAVDNQSDPVWSINLSREADGKTYFKLMDYFDASGCYCGGNATTRGVGNIPLVAGEWTHLEARYKWSQGESGVIQVWQNGVPIFSVTGVRTEYDYQDTRPRQWTVNVYGDDLLPNPFTGYVDDAAISTQRLHPLQLAGDFNSDGRVDAADYVVWRVMDRSLPGYLAWRQNFAAAAGAGNTVAEPQVLLIGASLSAVVRRRAVWRRPAGTSPAVR